MPAILGACVKSVRCSHLLFYLLHNVFWGVPYRLPLYQRKQKMKQKGELLSFLQTLGLRQLQSSLLSDVFWVSYQTQLTVTCLYLAPYPFALLLWSFMQELWAQKHLCLLDVFLCVQKFLLEKQSGLVKMYSFCKPCGQEVFWYMGW